MKKNKDTFSALVRQYERAGGTIGDLAAELNITRQTIHNYMRRDTLERAEETANLFEKTQQIVATRRADTLAALSGQANNEQPAT